MAITIAQSVTAVCLRAGLQPHQFDVSGLASITQPINSLTISQISTTRSTLEMLSSAYFFDVFLSDKLYFVARGGAAAYDLPYENLGTVVDNDEAIDPIPLVQSGELEVPAQIALTYYSIEGDYQPDTQYSDRLLSGQESVSTLQLPMSFSATEAKQIVDRMLSDQAWRLKTNISLDMRYTSLQPTDVVNILSNDGSKYRIRMLSKSETNGVLTYESVIDDSTISVQTGVTDGGVTGQTTVYGIPTTKIRLLDIPLLTDQENEPGIYVAVDSESPSWTLGAIYESIDNVNYNLVTTVLEQTTIGITTTLLGPWNDFNIFDNINEVTVNVGTKQLSSYTVSDVLTGVASGYLIGSEIIYALTAELISTGIYKLRGLLRGRKGTEWATNIHTSADKFVELSYSGMRFLPLTTSQLGATRYYKGVSAGQDVDEVSATSIIPVSVNLKPYSPVAVKIDRTLVDHEISWTRRTRLSARLTGALPITNPLGEYEEKYLVEIFSSALNASSGVPVLRSITVNTPNYTYTNTQRIEDGTGNLVVYLRVYQISNIVGKGTPTITSI